METLIERWAPFGAFVVIVLVALIYGTTAPDRQAPQQQRILKLEREVQRLEYACMPVDTGGGVTQCLQPNVRQTSGR